MSLIKLLIRFNLLDLHKIKHRNAQQFGGIDAMPKIEDDDRREFLKACGRFAAVTPPAMTLLLSTSLTSAAIAHSGGGRVGGSSGSRSPGSEHSFINNDREMGISVGGGGGGKGGTAEVGSGNGGSAPGPVGVTSGSSPSPGTTVHMTTLTTPSQTSATPNKSTDYFDPGQSAANSAFPNNDQRSVAHPAGSSTGVAAVQTNPTILNAVSSQTTIIPSSGAGIAARQTHRRKAGAGG